MPENNVPPQNLEAEESILGAMMLSPVAIDAVSEIVNPEDFYRESHSKIYRAAVALYARGEPVDAITLTDELEERGELDDVGGRVRLHELAALVPATGNVSHYAKIVIDLALIRGLIRAAGEISRLAWERAGEATALVDEAEQTIYALSKRGRTTARPIGEAVEALYKRLEWLAEHPQEVGYPSGFNDLDRVTHGFVPGTLTVLAARPGMGKSALALCIAGHLAVGLSLPVVIFTMEMSEEEFTQRLLALTANVELQKLRHPWTLSGDDWGAITAASGRLAASPLMIDDTGTLRPSELRGRVRRFKARSELALVVVDYLQLMTAERKSDGNRTADVSEISRQLKLVARDLEVPVLALSQLSRAVEQRTDKRPLLSDLRESGAIEQDADLVMFIYRDAYYNADAYDVAKPQTAEVIVAKNRNGETQTVKLAWVGKKTRFTSLVRAA